MIILQNFQNFKRLKQYEVINSTYFFIFSNQKLKDPIPATGISTVFKHMSI